MLLINIPISKQTNTPITRRNSINTPKPPPPIKRSSSITTTNPQTLQQLKNTPPKQLQSTSHNQNSNPNRTSLHRKNNNSKKKPTYAKLQTIQINIHTRQQLQYQPKTNPYASINTQQITYSTPPTPSQYKNKSIPPNKHYQPSNINQTKLIQKLNTQFSTLNTPYHQTNNNLPPPPPKLIQINPELPPPPSTTKLKKIKKIYNTPTIQRPPPINPKPTHPKTNPNKLKTSLISKLKKLRKISNNKNNSEY